MSGSAAFRNFTMASQGSFAETSSYGIRRLYIPACRRSPLILSVAVSVDEIYLAVWRKGLIVGSILIVLCGTTVVLCMLFRQEMLRRMVAESELVEAAERLSVIAATDDLTGLANRRAFDATLQAEWKRAIRAETVLALLMLDADCFKLYNDSYGHQEGDRVLETIGACIQENIRRPADLGARYGGEEFVVVLPETDLLGAVTVAEAIRSAIEGFNIPHMEAHVRD